MGDIETFTELANDICRQAICKVRIYFDDPIGMQEYTMHDYIREVNLLLENSVESAHPFGSISSNECVLTLKNEDRLFSANNPESPFYGYLVSDIKVEVLLGFLNGTTEIYTKVGIYWTSEWVSPSNSISTTIYCYDLLSRISLLKIPVITIPTNITYKALFELFFSSLGLTKDQYIVDDYLDSIKLTNATLPYDEVTKCLQQLAIGSLSRVFTDNSGVIKVLYMYRDRAINYEINNHNQIIDIKNDTDNSSIYNKAEVSYYFSSVEQAETIASLSNVWVDKGETHLSGIEFNEKTVSVISHVLVNSTSKNVYAYIENMTNTTISICVINNGDACQIDIDVIGNYIKNHKFSLSIDDTEIPLKYPRDISIDNIYVQSYDYAAIVAKALLAYTSDPNRAFTVNIRGNPLFNLNDIVKIEDDRYGYDSLVIVISRLKYVFNGSLKCELQGYKPVFPKAYVMISPGFFAEYTYGYVEDANIQDNLIEIIENIT